MDNARDALIESWLAEVDVGMSDEEVDNLEEEVHQSESEQEQVIPGERSDESSEDDLPQQRRRRTDFYKGVDDTLWAYKRTKNGVDLVAKMCSMYDVARNSRRWSLTIFFRLLNLSAFNALCIYTANRNYEPVSRREFLIDLSLALMKLLAQKRLENKSLPRTLTIRIKDFLGIPIGLSFSIRNNVC
ncbi:unnamed protein product [Spodoptera littoralis]|uniref:PiggyBac transposable element-derived protein domain-containing protein n=1 Tax=Spodoptera littoralis TaxID=7109 RepID=A0A9P0HYI9_SPOLI|nr:unnamed protein product [Spodoptera littoralis]CAH1636332.1 unnamed protein product [Spodoptera littoralis]